MLRNFRAPALLSFWGLVLSILTLTILIGLLAGCNPPAAASSPATVAEPEEAPPSQTPSRPTGETRPPVENTSTPMAKAEVDVPSAGDFCPPLPPPDGPTVTVSTEADLRNQAHNAAPGTTILIAPGTYHLTGVIHIVNNGITLRGSTGRREDVILDGGGMLTARFTHVILIEADDVTIADLTIRNGDQHGVSINGTDRPLLYNLHIVDTGYQLVKVNPVGDGSDDGVLACSRLEYTTTSPEEYTNGISAHNAHRWTVRDNEWYRIRTPGNTPAPAILFWSGSSDTVVERNLLVDCFQGIAFGNAAHGAGDHVGGVVRNNFIYASQPHDSVIEMVHATGWLVAHNTALLLNPYGGITWGMEARFADTSGTFANNLTNMPILTDRDGAGATASGNLVNAVADWFVDPANGDLHLASDALPPVDAAALLPEVPADVDGDPRPRGAAPDVGADEFASAQVYLPMILTPTAPAGTRLQPADLTYQGAFRLSDDFNWGALGLSFYPPGNGGAGSLLVTGFQQLYDPAHSGESCWDPSWDCGAYYGEVAIPPPAQAANWEDLPVAEILRPMTRFDGGLAANVHREYLFVSDLEYVPRRGTQSQDKLYGSINLWYAEGVMGSDTFPTIWFANLDGSGARGMFHVGPTDDLLYHGRKMGAYLFSVPTWYADQYLGGRTLITGRSRGTPAFEEPLTTHGGSQGPTLFAFFPWESDDPSGNLDALPLLYYRVKFPACAGPNVGDPAQCDYPNYTMCDEWTGGAFVEGGGKRAILLLGLKGLGSNCYDEPPVTCNDPCSDSHGYHCYPYEYQVVFYDVDELGQSAQGNRDPWTVLPYAIWRPSAFYCRGDMCEIPGGMTFDANHGRLFLVERELGGDTNAAIVHVWALPTTAP